MKKLLYVLLIINIFSMILAFFALLANSVIYAVIVLLLGILQLVPIIALIVSMNNIENMQDDLYYLYGKVKTLEEKTGFLPEKKITEEQRASITANGTWKCIKCGTVNKAQTTHCDNCKAAYSPLTNPTQNPNEKKKISRWVKYK